MNLAPKVLKVRRRKVTRDRTTVITQQQITTLRTKRQTATNYSRGTLIRVFAKEFSTRSIMMLSRFRSESFASDAQILKNLQEIKMQKCHDGVDTNKTPSSVNTSLLNAHNRTNNVGRDVNRKISLQKLKEHPRSECQTSSAETLISSESGE